MTPAVGLLLVVLGGEIGGHRETRFKLHHLRSVCGGCNGVAHLREGRGEESVMREVGARDPREGLGGFSELLSAVAGATEMIPEALGVVRVEAHRLPDPVDALFR